jgi:serine/threonine protein kinase
MELMGGGDLGDAAGDLGVAQSLWTATVVTDGVWHAHEHGVVHLDLKPSNVLFAEAGPDTWAVPKVADWELSRSLLDGPADVGITTPRYVAPEQARGDETDHRTDQFQLAVALYELFTGRHPFVADPSSLPESELVTRIREGDPTPPSRVRPALPPELDDALFRAVATDPADRYEATIDLRRAFERIADGDTPSAPGTGARRRDRQPSTEESAASSTTDDGSSADADAGEPATGADRSTGRAGSGSRTAQSESSDETRVTDVSPAAGEIRAPDESHTSRETAGWFTPGDYPEVTRRRLAAAIRAERERSVDGPIAEAVDVLYARDSESIAAALDSMRDE